MSRLEGRNALVTGAARGIGLAIARHFLAEGARVFLTDVREEDLKDRAAELGDHAVPQVLDVRREADWDRAVRELEGRFGSLDILVNNAGITGFEDEVVAHDPEHASLEDWRAVHRTNLDGTFLGCRAALRAMRPQRRGSILNIASRSGVVGIPRATAYASSKAAIRHHTKSVALYCAEEGLAIRCNCILPAAILTPMWDPVLGEGAERERNLAEHAREVPMKRFGTVDEVAALAVHLASDESSYTTGAEFHVDGGMLAGTAAPPPAPEG